MYISLNEHFKNTIRRDLSQVLPIQNFNEIPQIKQITISYNFINKNTITKKPLSAKQTILSILLLELLGGQRGHLVKAKKDSAILKVRKGQLVGVKTSLNQLNSLNFLERIIILVIPQIQFFSGFPVKSLTPKGTFSFYLENPFLFPEISQKYGLFKDLNNGIVVNINSTAKNQQELLLLLSSFQVPFTT